MQAFAVLICCFFLLLLLPIFLFVGTFIYRTSCTLVGLKKPTVLAASGVLLVQFVLILVAESIMGKVVEYCCVDLAGLPRWEAGVIIAFLFLPIDLLICSIIEAGLMGLKVGKAIEVWFINRLIWLCIVLAVAFVGVIVFLAQKN